MADGVAEDKSTPVYGPEPWRTVAGAEWSYWDLWFCTVCVVYHDGDWDALDAAIQDADRFDGEAKWSHLLSLTERLRHAGLSAGDLAANASDRKVRAKARAKVMKSTLYERDHTPAMCDPPSARLRRRALFGSWPEFPRSPQPPYDSVSARFDLVRRPTWDGWATSEMAYEVEREMIAHAGDDTATSLAIRRAFLTWYYEAAEVCDDSYGGLGDVAGKASRGDRIGQLGRAQGHGRRRCATSPDRRRHCSARRGRRPRQASGAGTRAAGPNSCDLRLKTERDGCQRGGDATVAAPTAGHSTRR